MFAKNYTGKNVSHLVNKDNSIVIAEDKKSSSIFFVSIWQQRNSTDSPSCPKYSVVWCYCSNPKMMHRFRSAMLWLSLSLKVRAADSDDWKAELSSFELGEVLISHILWEPLQYHWILRTIRVIMLLQLITSPTTRPSFQDTVTAWSKPWFMVHTPK